MAELQGAADVLRDYERLLKAGPELCAQVGQMRADADAQAAQLEVFIKAFVLDV